MNSLVIYYSFEGNTKFIAETLAELTNSDIIQLIPVEEIKTKGFMKYIWGGSAVFMKKEPLLKEYSLDLNKYDTIFIGTPVWAGNFAPPLRTFFKTTEIKNKKIGTFACYDGGKGSVFKKLREALIGNEIIGELPIVEPKKTGKSEMVKLCKEWIENIKTNP